MSIRANRLDGESSRPLAAEAERRILIVAPFGRDAQEIRQLLEASGYATRLCADAAEACEAIDQNQAAALLVAEEAFTDDARREFRRTLARQPAWSDFPLLLMTSSHRNAKHGWHVLRGLTGTAHLQVLVRPLAKMTLLTAVQTAMQSRQRQYQVRDELARRRRDEAELVRLNESLEQRVAERTAESEQRADDLRRLATELSLAEHRERKRLASLLHDELQQLLVSARLQLPDRFDGSAEQLAEQIERVDQLLRRCLRTSRTLARELCPPILDNGSLHQLFLWIANWVREHYGLEVEVAAGDAEPSSMPEHLGVFLHQSVSELLLNVIKHSGSMRARLEFSFQDGVLTLCVEDDGRGFDAARIESGLQEPQSFGLFNVAERLVALGGRMEFGNSRSGGASIRMVVPWEPVEAEDGQAGDPAAETPRPTTATSPPSPRKVRILVVDDHDVVREGFVSLLNQHQGFQVVGVGADGEQAVEQAQWLRPDAIVMDVTMPHLDGIEATRQIKQRLPRIAVVGLSLYDDQRVRQAMRDAGADAFLSKQTPGRELVATLRRVLSRSVSH